LVHGEEEKARGLHNTRPSYCLSSAKYIIADNQPIEKKHIFCTVNIHKYCQLKTNVKLLPTFDDVLKARQTYPIDGM